MFCQKLDFIFCFLDKVFLHVHDTPHAHEPCATHAHVPEAPVPSCQ